jgi:prephenate dehydratase
MVYGAVCMLGHLVVGWVAVKRPSKIKLEISRTQIVLQSVVESVGSVAAHLPSLAPEMVTRVGYQGVPGAYSEAASIEAFASAGVASIDAKGFHTFEDVFVALSAGEIDYGAVPVENTLGGSIHGNYDLLLRFHGCVHILGEYTLRVRHTLLALPGVQMSDIRKAMSHPQALAQTENYLRNAKITPVAGYDTAGSAKHVKEEGLRDTAAIASMHAASVHGLEVITCAQNNA